MIPIPFILAGLAGVWVAIRAKQTAAQQTATAVPAGGAAPAPVLQQSVDQPAATPAPTVEPDFIDTGAEFTIKVPVVGKPIASTLSALPGGIAGPTYGGSSGGGGGAGGGSHSHGLVPF